MRGSGIRLKCQHCEFENLEQATYCSGCGELLTPVMSDEVTLQTFEKKNRLILFSIIGVLILTLIGGGIWFAMKPDPIEVAKSAYQVNDLAAYQTAQKKMSSNQKSEMEAYLLDEANAVLESFKTEGLYYKEAIRKLERIKLYLTQIAPVQEVQNEVELIHTSREAYEQGKAWVEAKEWENARECFESVSELDPNYASAKRYLDSILRWQLQEILESFKTEGLYYKEAIRKLERIKLYLTQIAPVQEVQNEVELIHTSREAYEQGKAWVEAKEWENARECFESVSELDPNYASAKRYLDSILRWQLQEIGAEASAHYEAGDYEKALESIESGLSLEPDNEILINLKQNIETLLNQPPVEEETESDNEPVGFGEKLNSMIQSGLEALGDGIKSLFNGNLFGN